MLRPLHPHTRVFTPQHSTAGLIIVIVICLMNPHHPPITQALVSRAALVHLGTSLNPKQFRISFLNINIPVKATICPMSGHPSWPPTPGCGSGRKGLGGQHECLSSQSTTHICTCMNPNPGPLLISPSSQHRISIWNGHANDD